MSLSNAMKELLDRYLDGDLSAEERTAFEAQANTHPELSQEISLHRLVQSTLSNKAESDLLNNLQQIRAERHHAEHKKSEPKVRTMRPIRWIAAAASILILAIAAWWIFPGPDSSTPLTQAQAWIEADQLNRTEMSSEEDPVQKGIQYYNAGQFENAIEAFAQYDQQTVPPDWEVRIFLGKAYLQTQNYSDARKTLSSVETSGSLYQNEAKWWLALLDIITKQPAAAIQRLEKLAKEDRSDYKEPAQELLRGLR